MALNMRFIPNRQLSDSDMAIDTFSERHCLLQNKRTDLVKTVVFLPVPPEIFKNTEERIQIEMAILKAHGEKPASISCSLADEILREAVGMPDMPQDGKRGIELIELP